MKACDLFVVPNRRTYFDLITIEALSVGANVAVTKTGGNLYLQSLSSSMVFFDPNAQSLVELILSRADPKIANSCNQARYIFRDRRWEHQQPGRRLPKIEDPMPRTANKELWQKHFAPPVFGQNVMTALTNFWQTNVKPLHQLMNIPTTTPRVSIVVSIYNTSKYLKEAVDSCINQSLNNIEIILVDDGSTDASAGMCDDYAMLDDRVKVIHKGNGGLSSARNAGLRLCTSPFVCFLDSDDYYSPTFCDYGMRLLCDHDMQVVAFSVRVFQTNFEDSIPAYHCTAPYLHNTKRIQIFESSIENLLHFWPSAWNKIYRSSLLANKKWPDGLLYEDHPLFYTAFIDAGSFIYCNEALVNHRLDNVESITKRCDIGMGDIFVILDICYSIYASQNKLHIFPELACRLIWERTHTHGEYLLAFKQCAIEFAKARQFSLQHMHSLFPCEFT